MDSWGVAALADEPGALIAAWAAFHLDRGASEAHVCLDRPNEEARDLLSGVPGVFVTQSGDDDWVFNNVTKRPPRHLGRQKYHASRVLAQTGLDWIVHCDADEFVLPVTPRSVAEVLGEVRPGASWLRINVAERVHLGPQGAQIFDGQFRLPWDGFATRATDVYDDSSVFLLNRGLSGHQIGKSAVRAGRGLFLGVHSPIRDYAGRDKDIPRDGTRDLALLHFDGLTPLHYLMKMVRRAIALRSKNPPSHGIHRMVQIDGIALAGDDADLIRQQWHLAKQITPEQGRKLATEGVLQDYQPDIAGACARVLPHMPDLSPAAFDAALVARDAVLLEQAREMFDFDPERYRTGAF